MLSHCANNFTKFTEEKHPLQTPFTHCLWEPLPRLPPVYLGPSTQWEAGTLRSVESPSLCKGRASGIVPPKVSTLIRAHGARGCRGSEDQASIEAHSIRGCSPMEVYDGGREGKASPESLFKSETQGSSETPWSGHADAVRPGICLAQGLAGE